MKVGIFSDPHVNKKIQQIQSDWKLSVSESFRALVDQFKSAKIDMGICGGDFFDKALIEAWSLRMVMEVLENLNSLGVPIYFDLGNHEIESETENIIEFLDVYPNLKPITSVQEIDGFLIIPYSDKPEDYTDKMDGKIVISHHDIHGSSLAAGRSRAKFGIDPEIFGKARLVINGHIHTRSEFLNIRNIGSFLCTAQGEISPGQHPQAYILDTDTLGMTPLPNYKSIHFLTLDSKTLDSQLAYYQSLGCKVVLRYEYKDSSEVDYFEQIIPKYDNVLTHNLRRVMDLNNIAGSSASAITTTMIDIPTILQKHVMEDSKVEDTLRQEIIDVGKKLLDKGRR